MARPPALQGLKGTSHSPHYFGAAAAAPSLSHFLLYHSAPR